MIVRLDEISKTTPGVGKKARRLAKLMNSGFSIPEGFVITSDDFAQCFMAIDKELMSLSSSDDMIMKASKLQSAFSEVRLPSEVESDAAKQYLEMEIIPNLPKSASRFIAAGRDIPVAAVRISGEADYPYAHAILNVYGQKQLLFSIKKAISSTLSAQMLDFALKKGMATKELLNNAVIIQKFIPGEIFGTVMRNPVKDGWLVEYTDAQNFFNSLMYGATSPKRIEVSSQSNEAHVMEGKYSIEKMTENLKKAEEVLGESLALEWCIARDRIYILDAKPLGKISKSASGKVKKTLSSIGHEDIVVLENSNSEFFPIPEKLAVIICQQGSYSSALANYCRYLGIPFFIMDASNLENGQEINIVNGLLPGELRPEPASAAAQAAKHAVKYEPRAFPERITKLSVILQPKTVFTESSSLANFDEIIITDKDYISLADKFSKPISYLLKSENDAEALRSAFPEGSFRILFDSFEPDIIAKVKEDFPESATGFIVKTPYDMLRIREIQPFANVVIYDIANIVKLMINRESDEVDDNMLKQLRSSMKTCKEHGIECYCCNFSNNSDEELLKKLILIGADGIVVREEQANEFALALERAEKKIMIDLARKAFQF